MLIGQIDARAAVHAQYAAKGRDAIASARSVLGTKSVTGGGIRSAVILRHVVQSDDIPLAEFTPQKRPGSATSVVRIATRRRRRRTVIRRHGRFVFCSRNGRRW